MNRVNTIELDLSLSLHVHFALHGVSELIIHCGVADSELKSIMSNYAIRSGDRAVFTDPDVISEIRNSGVSLISWKQLYEMTEQQPNH